MLLHAKDVTSLSQETYLPFTIIFYLMIVYDRYIPISANKIHQKPVLAQLN